MHKARKNLRLQPSQQLSDSTPNTPDTPIFRPAPTLDSVNSIPKHEHNYYLADPISESFMEYEHDADEPDKEMWRDRRQADNWEHQQWSLPHLTNQTWSPSEFDSNVQRYLLQVCEHNPDSSTNSRQYTNSASKPELAALADSTLSVLSRQNSSATTGKHSLRSSRGLAHSKSSKSMSEDITGLVYKGGSRVSQATAENSQTGGCSKQSQNHMQSMVYRLTQINMVLIKRLASAKNRIDDLTKSLQSKTQECVSLRQYIDTTIKSSHPSSTMVSPNESEPNSFTVNKRQGNQSSQKSSPGFKLKLFRNSLCQPRQFQVSTPLLNPAAGTIQNNRILERVEIAARSKSPSCRKLGREGSSSNLCLDVQEKLEKIETKLELLSQQQMLLDFKNRRLEMRLGD